jgi:hypothetical protein
MVYEKDISFEVGVPERSVDDTAGFAKPVGFRLAIDRLKFPNAEFNVQTASIPEISVNAAQYATPQRTIEVSGDKVTYAPLTISFIIDENLTNYNEIHDWLFGLVTVPEDRSVSKTRDMSLLILDSHNNVSREITFANSFPTSLSTLDFDAKSTDVEYLIADASFSYSYFKVK